MASLFMLFHDGRSFDRNNKKIRQRIYQEN